MTKLKIIFGLFICSILFWFCQKKLFATIEVKGRILHAATLQPFYTKVYLYGDDATTAKNSGQGTVQLCSTTSNQDGTFTLKTNASQRPNYYLWVDKGNSSSNVNPNGASFTVADNSTKDLGDVLVNW